MPIYEYRCAKCGFQQDVLQRLNEAPLTKCPECGKRAFKKQVTAAGFQLKGTGWYATDFKNSGTKKPGDKAAAGSGKDASGKDSAAKESSPKESTTKESTTKESKSESSGAATSGAGS